MNSGGYNESRATPLPRVARHLTGVPMNKTAKKVPYSTPTIPFPSTFRGQLEKWGVPAALVCMVIAFAWALWRG
jgi:hypothetical protein